MPDVCISISPSASYNLTEQPDPEGRVLCRRFAAVATALATMRFVALAALTPGGHIMKRRPVTTYRFRERYDDGDLRKLMPRFLEAGTDAGIIEDAEQESEATGGYGHGTAGSFDETPMPPRRGSGGLRPNTAPAYYLGRPASLWISVMSPGRKCNAPKQLTGGALGASAAAPAALANRARGAA